MPGLTHDIKQAGTDIAAWAKNRQPRSSPGLRDRRPRRAASPLSGTLSKAPGNGVVAWLVNTFNKINWADVGHKAAAVMCAGMKALFNLQVSLGQAILGQFGAIDGASSAKIS